MIKVGIIDDGIGQGVYGNFELSHNIEITPQLEVIYANNNYISSISHGTVCAAIVKKYYPDAILSSVKILNSESHMGTKFQLVKAIQWCIFNKMQVINISLGTIDYKDFNEIKKIINIAYQKGILIIAACNNKDIYTCPASYNNIIGVRCNKKSNLKEGQYIFNLYPIEGIEIISCAEHELATNEADTEVTTFSNSYAAPMITAEVCKIKNRFPKLRFREIKEKLYKGSINYSENITRTNNHFNIDWMSNGAILNLDNKSLKISSKYKIDEIKFIKNSTYYKYDTLIVLDSILKTYKNNRPILEYFNNNHKNIIVMDDKNEDCESDLDAISKCNNLWHPLLIKHFYEGDLATKKIDIPIIAFYYYTDNPNDKILELVKNLNCKFRNDGYFSIGATLSSIGILYGLDYIPNNKIDEIVEIRKKLEILYKIYDCDVIILGLKIDINNLDYIKEFIKCINPDINIFNSEKLTWEIEDLNINEKYMIIDKEKSSQVSDLDYKVFKYNELSLLYNEIVYKLV